MYVTLEGITTDRNPDLPKLNVDITFTEVGITMLRSLYVTSKLSAEISVMEVGRLNEDSKVLANAKFPIVVTLVGIVRDTIALCKKALIEMEVTDVGIVTLTRERQSMKAVDSIDKTEVGITMTLIPHDSKTLVDSNVTEVGMVTETRLRQFEKALVPSEVTEVGMTADCRLVLFRKSADGSEETVVGMTTVTRRGHWEKAAVPMAVIVEGITTTAVLAEARKALSATAVASGGKVTMELSPQVLPLVQKVKR
mmetsp:Transcript_23464/g.32111  ORF Transcript_23464/g.32111 Transcript_23464/m.32111 type:complete len:253 (-) Transcript_23464:1517-2275(-)